MPSLQAAVCGLWLTAPRLLPEWHQAARPLSPVSLAISEALVIHAAEVVQLTCVRHARRWNQKRTYEGIMEDLGGDIICIQGQQEPRHGVHSSDELTTAATQRPRSRAPKWSKRWRA